MSAAFIIFFLAEIFYDIKDHFNTTQLEWRIWDIIAISKYVIAITILILLALFMKNANSGQLFSNKSSKLWIYKSYLLLIIGSLSFIEMLYNDEDSLHFVFYIFLASFFSAMSTIFKEAEILKSDNDLTI
jgi:hypothetical protein